jgi:hypothetical protein
VLWKLDESQSVSQFDLKDDNLADNVERWKTYRTFLYVIFCFCDCDFLRF